MFTFTLMPVQAQLGDKFLHNIVKTLRYNIINARGMHITYEKKRITTYISDNMHGHVTT